MPNAEAERGLHPARPRNERREARSEEDAARPGSFRWESTAGSCCEVKRPSYEVVTGRRMWRKTQLGQGLHWEATPGGTAETWKRPACDVIANRRVLKLRPGYSKLCRRHGEKVRAHGALQPGHRGPSARRTPSPVSSGRSDQLQPPNRCPAGEAINSNRQTGVQRKKGLSLQPPDGCPAEEGLITPTAGRVSRGRRAYHSNRRTCPEGEGLITPTHWTRPRTKGLITPSIGPCCVRRA